MGTNLNLLLRSSVLCYDSFDLLFSPDQVIDIPDVQNYIHSPGKMIPFLFSAIAIATGWSGFLFDGDNHRNRCKVIESWKVKCSLLDREVPPSLANQDHISELPDDLLYNILARLSLRDVVRMATISKWWRSVCLSLPFLNLDWYVMSGYKNSIHNPCCENWIAAFVKSVDQVLQKRMKDRDILSFRLAYCLNYSEYAFDIDRWISFVASNKGLESLSLQFCCSDLRVFFERNQDEQFVIHGSWFAQVPLLKALHLDTCILEGHSEFQFNNIVTLNLCHVTLKGFQWQSVISNSTTIKWLRLAHCELPEKLRIGENLDSLSLLFIDRCHGLKEIGIHAKNLKTLEFGGEEFVKFVISDTLKLESLAVWFWINSEDTAQYMYCDLVKNIPFVKTLSLRSNKLQVYKLPMCKASYESVTRLNITMQHDDPEIDFVMELSRMLKLFPVLEMFCMTMPNLWIFRSDKRPTRTPEPYLNYKLKEVQLYNFSHNWTEFANFVLKSAIVLNLMMLKSYTKLYEGGGKWRYCQCHFYSVPGESERICKAVEGNAISTDAKVFIVDTRCMCCDDNCMFAN